MKAFSPRSVSRSVPRRVVASLLVAALLVAAAFCLAACARKDKPAVFGEVPLYDIDLTYDGNDSLSLAEEIVFLNDTGNDLDDVRLHLYANAFSEGAEHPPYLPTEKDDFFIEGESFGGIEISNAEINGKTIDYEISEDGQVLVLPADAEAGEVLEIAVEADITLPRCRSRLGVSERTVNLAGFYPSLCVYENGAWREEGYTAVGDPFYSEISSFYVTLAAPEGYLAAGSGSMLENTATDGTATFVFSAENVRDFALCLSREFEVLSASFLVDGRNVTVDYYTLGQSDAEGALAAVVSALETFSATFGAYPYPRLTVAESHIHAGGMEYGSFVVLDASVTDPAALRDVAVHETAHQWWFGVVGSDQLNTAWLDEGLTEFCTAYYHLLRGDGDTYRAFVSSAKENYLVYRRLPAAVGFDGAMSRPLSSFLTDGEYVAVTYAKGVLLFDTLLQLAGRDKFDAALADYFSSNAYAIATPADLTKSFVRAGFDASGIIASFAAGTEIIN